MQSKAIVFREVEGPKGQVYYPLERVVFEIPSPKGKELLVKILAAAFNHCELVILEKPVSESYVWCSPLLGWIRYCDSSGRYRLTDMA